MALLGSPKSGKTMIGTFELRIGSLSEALKMTSNHSVGIIDNVKIDMQMDSVDLLSGFPQQPVDTAITKFTTAVSAALRENSARNLKVLLGSPSNNSSTVDAYDATNVSSAVVSVRDAGGTVTSQITKNVVCKLEVASASGFGSSDVITISNPKKPSQVHITTVSGAPSGNIISLATTFPFDIASTDITNLVVQKSKLVAGGDITGAPTYFTAQLLRTDRKTGTTVGFNFWKCAISSGISWNANVTEFATLDLNFKVLVPTSSDLTDSNRLSGVKTYIDANPAFMIFDTSDSVAASTDST